MTILKPKIFWIIRIIWCIWEDLDDYIETYNLLHYPEHLEHFGGPGWLYGNLKSSGSFESSGVLRRTWMITWKPKIFRIIKIIWCAWEDLDDYMETHNRLDHLNHLVHLGGYDDYHHMETDPQSSTSSKLYGALNWEDLDRYIETYNLLHHPNCLVH